MIFKEKEIKEINRFLLESYKVLHSILLTKKEGDDFFVHLS